MRSWVAGLGVAVGAAEVEEVVIEEREHVRVLEATAENCPRLQWV